MTYKEQLANPKWQKRRLEILQRDEWSCQICHDEETELHVHHKKYTGRAWQAPSEDLETLCKNCHTFLTNFHRNWDDYEVVSVKHAWYYDDRYFGYRDNITMYLVFCLHKFAKHHFLVQCLYDNDSSEILTMPIIHRETIEEYFEVIKKHEDGKV